MISKNQIKYYSSLQKKKFRDAEQLFLVEGHRSVVELFQTDIKIDAVLATAKWFGENDQFIERDCKHIECGDADLKKISSLQTQPPVIAVAKMPSVGEAPVFPNSLVLALDTIQDPGNLGTIIRTADWFGITDVVCSLETVDVYNSKVIQSTMGALGRVNVYYTSLTDYLSEVKKASIPIYGTLLTGKNMYSEKLSACGVIVMGNEGNGISAEVETLVSKPLYIPPFPIDSDKVESLNVGVATSIVCAEFRRQVL